MCHQSWSDIILLFICKHVVKAIIRAVFYPANRGPPQIQRNIQSSQEHHGSIQPARFQRRICLRGAQRNSSRGRLHGKQGSNLAWNSHQGGYKPSHVPFDQSIASLTISASATIASCILLPPRLLD